MRIREKLCGTNNKLGTPVSFLHEGCLTYRLRFINAKLFPKVLEKPQGWKLEMS